MGEAKESSSLIEYGAAASSVAAFAAAVSVTSDTLDLHGASQTENRSTSSQSEEGADETLSAENKAAARTILHASLFASTSTIADFKRSGRGRWLNKQMRSSSGDEAEEFFSREGFDEVNSSQHWRRDYYFDHMIWSDLMAGGSAVRKRMAIALSEIFVVSLNGLDMSWPAQAVGWYWDTLKRHAFGNYRELIEEIALSPAMGVFLDTRGNQHSDPTSGRVPDENFARELLQLFSIGLYELEADGQPRLRGGRPIETYSNEDVEGLARVFTGYDLDYTDVEFQPHPLGRRRSPIPSPKVVRQRMTVDPAKWWPAAGTSLHSLEEKSFLGATIPPGTGPEDSLQIALDVIFNHPNVGPFISKQLIQRLVTSNPSPGYVWRVARRFNNNGKGVRGDLGAVFRAIIRDKEANATSTLVDPSAGKLREPMLRYAQWGRTFGARSPSGQWEMRDLSEIGLLNQAPFRSPSVFNFFRPGYVPPTTQAAANDLVVPEFQIVNESSVAAYLNFMRGAVEGEAYWSGDVSASYSNETAIAHEPTKLLDHLDLILTAGQLSDFVRGRILESIEAVGLPPEDDDEARLLRAQVGVLLTMLSNDYLVQR
ncbi:MAG: DUF1800 family protein [Pseudomonadota bacterium]